MVQVKNIADMGAYVSLLEYNNIEGMILLSELSRRRIRSISSLIKVGRQEPVMVVRVDKQKGYIDLSKRRVSEEEVAACEEKYNKSKMVHSIMRHVAETSGVDVETSTYSSDFLAPLRPPFPLSRPPLLPPIPRPPPPPPLPPAFPSPLPPPFPNFVVAVQELYTNVTWPLYRKYGHAFEVKREVPAMVEDVKANLIANIRRRMTPQPLKIRADIELKCFHYDGVLHIKVRRAALQTCFHYDVFLYSLLSQISSPVNAFDLSPDIELKCSVLERAIRAASEEIDKHKGKLTVKEAPRAVSDRDDRLLAEHMQKLTDANVEVDGDVDSEDEDEGMGSVDIDNAGLTE
ncbi:unnamed protein product [Closterium sp. NIES-53]